MILDAITETGATYRIDTEDRFWLKMRNGRTVDVTQTIWQLKVSKEKIEKENLTWPYENEDLWESAELPVVGRNLYIAGRDSWYVSTPVVEIIERESWAG